jgi:hypothetical protein
MFSASDSSLNARPRFKSKPESIPLNRNENRACFREYALDCGAADSMFDFAPQIHLAKRRVRYGMAILDVQRITPES